MDINRVAWNDDDAYWRANYRTRPYAKESGRNYEFYRPAYLYGYDAANRFPEHEWEEIAPDLAREWKTQDIIATSHWDEIAGAVRDAWDLVMRRRAITAP